MYFTDSHIQGILLAFGIIYKAWLLCGALSPCLLPLLPMTLPGLPSAPNAPSATLPAEGTEFGVKAKPFICCCCYFLFLYVQSLSIFILCKKQKSFLIQKVIMCKDKHKSCTSERHTKLPRTIPYGPDYPVIQESFFPIPFFLHTLRRVKVFFI